MLRVCPEVRMKAFFNFITRLFIVSGVVLLALHAGCKKSGSIPDNPLTGIKWNLESIQYAGQQAVPVERIFNILFNEDFSFRMQVDCNTCSGAYALGDNNALSFSVQMACTDAFCGDESPDQEFHAAIETVSRYDIDGNNLRLYFNGGQSHLSFISALSSL
jgi:heat shock protein HslJ